MEECIITFLEGVGKKSKASEIAKSINFPKAEVNKWLYDHKFKQISPNFQLQCEDGTPPLWWLTIQRHSDERKITTSPTTKTTSTLVLIDLGNVHDVAKAILPYAEKEDVYVMCFADKTYNGYPSVDPPRDLHFHRAETTNKNAADFLLIFHLISYLNSVPDSMQVEIYICSKDSGVAAVHEILSLETMREKIKNLKIVPNWDELRIYIE